MTTQANTQKTQASTEKPGFFKRLFDKVDKKMQAKAEEKAAEGCCCCGDDADTEAKDKCC